MERQSITIKEKNYYIPDQSYLVDLIESYMGYDIAQAIHKASYIIKYKVANFAFRFCVR